MTIVRIVSTGADRHEFISVKRAANESIYGPVSRFKMEVPGRHKVQSRTGVTKDLATDEKSALSQGGTAVALGDIVSGTRRTVAFLVLMEGRSSAAHDDSVADGALSLETARCR